MDILIIAVLILLGLLFLLAELFILPGVSIGGVLSAVCYGAVIYLSFNNLGTTAGFIVIGISLLLSIIAVIVFLRAKTWDRVSLKSQIESASSSDPKSEIVIGVQGVAISRLSPMGRVEIGGKCFEAKSFSGYIDENSSVEVVGFENFSVIVKRTTK